MSLAFLVFALVSGTVPADDPASLKYQLHVVRVLGDTSPQVHDPLDIATFGEKGDRVVDYDLIEHDSYKPARLIRRRISPEEDGEPEVAIPLGIDKPVASGRPGVFLHAPSGRASLAKGETFSLAIGQDEPEKLRAEYGPGVYEGFARLKITVRGGDDRKEQVVKGDRPHNIYICLVIPGRRAIKPKLAGIVSVGQRPKLLAAIEQVLPDEKEPEKTTSDDRLHVKIEQEKESGNVDESWNLPWPVPAPIEPDKSVGLAWDPRNLGSSKTMASGSVTGTWLDEPILVNDPGTEFPILVDHSKARSIFFRQTLALPPLFAPGKLSAWVETSGAKEAPRREIAVRSGLWASPGLAFLGEPIRIRAVLSRNDVTDPPSTVSVQVTSPDGKVPKTYELRRDENVKGYWLYDLKGINDRDRPRASVAGYYRIRGLPIPNRPELNEALDREIRVFVALKRDDRRLRNHERVAFVGTPPIHWDIVRWWSSYLKDGALHSARTANAIELRAERGPEEIEGLTARITSDPPDTETDGVVGFVGPGARNPETFWSFDQKTLPLALSVNIDAQVKNKALTQGPRLQEARFLVSGKKGDQAFGRIFVEPIAYEIASQSKYYLELAVPVGLILAAGVIVWAIIRKGRGTRGRPKKGKKRGGLPPTSPQSTGGYFDGGYSPPVDLSTPTPPPTQDEPPQTPFLDKPAPPSGGGGNYFD